ncbi:zinc finger, CCHC-type containing protein [Tanacetum coccineum]|uniref:Zinc finger, CCHC-type containing protein n=1 Tax=Tanacetum coccineum TaxID=301880 RepID=A0ABQ5D6E3_9ASTR
MRDWLSFVLDNVKYVPELRRNLISLGTLKKDSFTVKIQSGKIKVIKGSLMVLLGTRRANCVYTLYGQVVTWMTLKGSKQLEEYQTGWKIKTGNVLDSCNQGSTQQCIESGTARHLGIAGIQQQNGLVEETNMTLLAKVCCFMIQSGLSNVFWVKDTTMSTYLVNMSPSSAIEFKTPIDMLGVFGWLASIKQRMLELVKVKCIFLGYHEGMIGYKLWSLDDGTSKVVLYKNMGFNDSEKYKKTFIGSSVGTDSVQVLQGVEFEMEPQEDHTIEVEPHGNVDHVVGSQEVQTHVLIDYHSTRDREQHSAHKLFTYKEGSNEAAFAVAVVEKIHAHESLTFNNTVA